MITELRIRVDEDCLRLAAYRLVLQEIARDGDDEPWATHPHAEMARDVLRHFRDEPKA